MIENREQIARNFAKDLLARAPDSFANPFTVLASPAWRGVEGDVWRASANGNSIVLKHYHPDVKFFVDINVAMEAATNAAALNVGPAVLKTNVDDGLIAFADLQEPWRAGGLHDARNPKVRAAVIECKKTFQSGSPLTKSTSIFAEIKALARIAAKHDVFCHRDLGVFLEFFNEAGDKIKSLGKDKLPCHRDGNTANIMVRPDNAVQLIDFDLAANCDPFEDVGCHLMEYFENDADAREGFEEWNGSFNEGLFQRSMLYGLADDMRWGLIGHIMAAKSPRSALEFGKYAAWRFIRLEMQAKRSDAIDRIRKVA